MFIIECVGVTECRVSFEPEGWEHVLREDDLFRVEALPPAGAHVEIAYRDDGITVVLGGARL